MNKDIKEQLDILKDVKANIKQSIIGRKQEVPDDKFSTLVESCIAIDGDDFSQHATNKDMNASIARKGDNALVYSKDTNTLGGLYKHNGTTYSAVPTSFTANKNLVYGGNYLGSKGVETGTMDNFTPSSQAELHTYLDIYNNINENGVIIDISHPRLNSSYLKNTGLMPTKYVLTDKVEIASFSSNKGFTELTLVNNETNNLKTLNLEHNTNLKKLDLSNFHTNKITNMTSMLYGCKSLKDINLANLDTSNVVNMRYLFNGCSSVEELDISSFNTNKVTDMYCMFGSCDSLVSIIYGDNWNTENVTNMSWMFSNLSNLKTADLSKFNTSKVTTMNAMFYHNLYALEEVILGDGWNVENVTNFSNMFGWCFKLKSISNIQWNVKNATDMGNMFDNCNALESIDVSNWNTENVTNMRSMFNECRSLQVIDVSNWNTENVTNMGSMFFSQKSPYMAVEKLDVSNWNVNKVTNMEYLFRGCKKVQNFDISKWNLKNVTNMGGMFATCDGMTQEGIQNILKALPTATSLAAENKTLSYLSLEYKQREIAVALPEWEACVAAGWRVI